LILPFFTGITYRLIALIFYDTMDLAGMLEVLCMSNHSTYASEFSQFHKCFMQSVYLEKET
jgi:hypothetical protein